MAALASLLEQMEPQLQDNGATSQMQELGGKLQEIKDLFHTMAGHPLERRAVAVQADLTNRALLRLVQELLAVPLAPDLLAQGFLYYWLRLSTINANVPQGFFQKLERHWSEVIERVSVWVNKLC